LEHADRDEQLIAGGHKLLALLDPAVPPRAQETDERAGAGENADGRGYGRIEQIGPG
jgi:hypothetical protein